MYRRLSQVLVVLLALSLALVFAGCAKTSTTPRVAVYASANQPIVFWDPSDSYSNEIIVMNNIYETLLRYDPTTDKLSPILATAYQVSPDGLAWTFDLRKGVKFHTGNEMTADSVKACVERTMQRGLGAAFIWSPVKEIKALDRYKVEFDLSYPAPLDMIAASGYGAHIFDPAVVQENGEEWFSEGHEAGTGPYVLESFKGKEEVVLAKFADYWRGWKGQHFDKVVFQEVSEASTRAQMVQAGQVDFVDNLPIEQIDRLRSDPAVAITTTPSFQNLLGFLNTQTPPLDNKLVRQAVSYAVPYEQIITEVMKGTAVQGQGPVPGGMWGHNDSLFQYTQDLTKAKDLLTQAGFPNGGFKLTLTYASGDETERRVAEIFKASLAQLNIDLEIRGMPWEPQWDLAKATKPADRQDIFVMYWWPDYSTPYSWLNAMYHSEDTINFNLAYYKNPEYDQVVDDAQKLSGSDRAKAIEKFAQAQQMLVDDTVCLYFFDQSYVRAMRADFQGYVDNPSYPHVVFFYDTHRSSK